jgi:hypothetical protein
VGIRVDFCVERRGFGTNLQASSFQLLRVYKSHFSIVLARAFVDLNEGGADRILRRWTYLIWRDEPIDAGAAMPFNATCEIIDGLPTATVWKDVSC